MPQIFLPTNLKIRVADNQIFKPTTMKLLLGRYQISQPSGFKIKALGLFKSLRSQIRVHLNPATIQFYDGSGTSELANIFDIFSGTSIPRGSTSSAQSFRVYNNYSGSLYVSNAEDMKIQISGNNEFLTDNVMKKTVHDYTRQLILGGYIEIRCVIASETGLSPPSGNTFRPLLFGTPFSGSGFDEIVASGSFNYNEYEIRFNLPASGVSGSWNASGVAYPSLFVDYNNEGYAYRPS